MKNTCLNLTGNYTSKMLVPYFGTETDPEISELRESDPFFDFGIKLHYNMKLNGATLQWFGGIKIYMMHISPILIPVSTVIQPTFMARDLPGAFISESRLVICFRDDTLLRKFNIMTIVM